MNANPFTLHGTGKLEGQARPVPAMQFGCKKALSEACLASLASNHLSPEWADVEAVLSKNNDHVDVVAGFRSCSSAHPEFLAAAALRLSDANVTRLLVPELTVHWLMIPLPEWACAVAGCLAMWDALMGRDEGAAQGAVFLHERMRGIKEAMPALTTTMDWLQYCQCGNVSAAIIEAALAQSSSPSQLVDSLWVGDDCLLQKVLLRTHVPEQVWPSSMIGKRALAALCQRVPESMALLIDPVRSKSGQGILWPLVDDHKAAVVNIPVLMGFWATTSISMDWWRRTGRLRQVMDIYTFDPLWFQVAYNQGVKIALAYGMNGPYANGEA